MLMLRQWTKSKPSEPVNLLSNKTIIPNKTFQDTSYLKRPKVLMVGDSVVYNTNFWIVEKVTRTTIKTIKDKNVTAVVKDELEKDIFDHLVLNHTKV